MKAIIFNINYQSSNQSESSQIEVWYMLSFALFETNFNSNKLSCTSSRFEFQSSWQHPHGPVLQPGIDSYNWHFTLF